MTASIIGALLDSALEFAANTPPKPVTVDLSEYDTEGMSGIHGPQTVQPRSVARALLANRVRDLLATLFNQDAVWSNGDPCPPYRKLAAIGHKFPDRNYDLMFEEDVAPDALVRMPSLEPIIAVEVCYGFEEETVMAAMDRLLGLTWTQSADPLASQALRLVACVFVHETGFGETIRDTERHFNDWIGEKYGPHAGMDRIHLPMMPRLTRSATVRPASGAIVSSIDLTTHRTGYVAFCISYDVDGA